jgi:hypothetical protein
MLFITEKKIFRKTELRLAVFSWNVPLKILPLLANYGNKF